MLQLNNKQILLGVTGGIAAYKAAELIRRLKDVGADVRVVMTKAAQEFITPLTLQALSGNTVHTSLLDPEAEAAMGHIELARWADLILVAPASADFMARVVCGQADDLLTTLCLASDAPIAIAPAMNQAMWRDRATQHNAQILIDNNVAIFGPGDGAQACGDVGPGRMLEPEQIAELAAAQFQTRSLDGANITITAGPTLEAIDPVRYISNHSSGKMGFALAQAAVEAGANVTLIAGPVHLSTPEHVTRIDIKSAAQMLDACIASIDSCDIFIGCAAVADYRPANPAEQKIKKTAGNDNMVVELIKNTDIIATVANHRQRPFSVGFAAETQDVLEYAQGKLDKKNLDMIIANDVSDPNTGFNSDSNTVIVVTKNQQLPLPTKSKKQLGRDIIKLLASHYQGK